MMDSFPKRVYYNGPHTSLIHQKLSKKHNSFPINELLARLPKIGIKVFKEFDNYTLTNLRIVSNSMKTCIDQEHFYWMRQLQSCEKYIQEVCACSSKTFFMKFIKDSTLAAKKQIIKEAKNGFLEDTMAVLFIKDYSKGTTPLHHAAEIGHLTICGLILSTMEEKCPKNKVGSTPLHTAAFYGHLEVYRLISKSCKDKNPADLELGKTPLHWAAKNGHMEICEFIIDNSEDINPKTKNGVTPFQLAAHHGHLEICEMMAKKVYKPPSKRPRH